MKLTLIEIAFQTNLKSFQMSDYGVCTVWGCGVSTGTFGKVIDLCVQ